MLRPYTITSGFSGAGNGRFSFPLSLFLSSPLVAAIVWPRTYRSTSTILIEEQEIPRDFVVTTVTGYADERLQSINQRIMSTTRLLEIINRFNLYADLRKRMTTEEVVEIMRKDIKFETISADVMDKKGTARSAPGHAGDDRLYPCL